MRESVRTARNHRASVRSTANVALQQVMSADGDDPPVEIGLLIIDLGQCDSRYRL
jgi:hypothetical protein